MKAIVKAPFYDDNGLHRIGDVIETAVLDPLVMEEMVNVKKAEPDEVVEEIKKKATKKTTKK